MMRPNPLKQRLKAGEKCYGTWLLWAYPSVCEVIAQCGSDAVMIDHEHGVGGLPETLGCLQALSATPTAGPCAHSLDGHGLYQARAGYRR